MADVSKTISIIFKGVDELSGSISTVTSGIGQVTDQVEAMAAPLANAANNVLKVDAALAAFAAAGLVVAFNSSVKFESAVLELQKVLGEGMSTEFAVSEATRLSETYGISSTEIIASIANFKQANYDLDESIKLTTTAMDLAIAGDMEMARASELVVSALKGFGAEADQATRFIDILNKVSNNYATSASELGEGMARISPIASQMGFTMEETAGILTPIIEVFRSGSEAANALKTGLLRITKATPEVTASLEFLGVSQTDVNGEMRSGHDIYIDVATAMVGLTKEQQIYHTGQLTGIMQTPKMAVIFTQLALSTQIAAVALGEAGAASEEVRIRLASAEVQIDIFKAAFDNMSRVVGDQFKLAAVEAIKGATDIEIALRKMVSDGTFDEVFKLINSFGTDLGVLLSKIAINLPAAFEGIDWGPILDSMKAITEAVVGMFEGMDLSTPQGLHDVIQKVINTLGSLGQTTAGIIEGWTPFVRSIWDAIEAYNAMDDASKISAGEIGALAQQVTMAGLEIAAMIIALGPVASGLTPIFEFVIGSVTGLIDGVEFFYNAFLLTLIEVVDAILAASGLLTNIPGLGGFADDVEANRAVLDEWRQNAIENIEAVAEKSAEKHSGISNDFEGTGNAATDLKDKISAYGTSIDDVPDEKTTQMQAELDEEELLEIGEIIDDAIPDEKTTTAKGETDTNSTEKVKSDLNDAMPFKKTTEGGATTGSSVAATKKDIDEAIPQSKIMEIELQGDIDMELARIETQAETMQTAFEWDAKLNIAQLEADSKEAVAMMQGIATSVEASASAAADMFGSLLDNWDKLIWASEKNALMGMVQQQLDMEQQALDMQRDMVDAQISYLEQKAEALSSGDGLIKITSDGLEPALEAIMWQILEKVQLRASEEAAEFLLGMA